MKRLSYILFLSALVGVFSSCEDQIFPPLPDSPDFIVVDAWINDLPQKQVVSLTTTLPYYDALEQPTINGATVTITDDQGKVYNFVEEEDGQYVWNPTAQEPTFGAVGRSYTLDVDMGNTQLRAFSAMNRVPTVDSITFRFEPGNDFFPDSYFGSFYATDPQGLGDTYWIKPYKNGAYLNKPSEISLAYDAGFSAGSAIDGIAFIQPIRDSVNPFDQDAEDNFLSPYAPGDSLVVELHSITNEAHDFLTQVSIQIDRPGGFGELFATPLSNVPSNIENVSSGERQDVIGFFNVGSVSRLGGYLDPNDLPVEE